MDISVMADESAFQQPNTLKKFLAQQLVEGRLALVLGAGASFAFNLPDWQTLVERVASKLNYKIAKGVSNEALADGLLLEACNGDELKFAREVRTALYDGSAQDASIHRLTETPLLVALGALAMCCARAGSCDVISFNFDNLLELYLRYHGFVVESVGGRPHWDSGADVKVLHVHGLLPHDPKEDVSKIIFAQIHFDQNTGRSDNRWRAPVLTTLTSKTCLFVGLSGRDQNLRSWLVESKEGHPGLMRGDAYWGVRFGVNSDAQDMMMWRTRGVFPLELASYDKLPSVLLDICEQAAMLTAGHRGI